MINKRIGDFFITNRKGIKNLFYSEEEFGHCCIYKIWSRGKGDNWIRLKNFRKKTKPWWLCLRYYNNDIPDYLFNGI